MIDRQPYEQRKATFLADTGGESAGTEPRVSRLGDRTATLFHGNASEVLAGLKPESVHAFVTDPDYGIASNTGRAYKIHKRMFQGWETAYSPNQLQAVTTEWATQALRVAVPGAHLVSFGGDRTIHRITAGLEDAGWDIKAMWVWRHNQGQLLGTNLRHSGWSTRLRQQFEPIILARKPVARVHKHPVLTLILDNHVFYGTGLLNIDALRGSDGRWPSTVFDCPKPRGECPDDGHGHTTIKPLALMRRLVRAVTPVGPEYVVCDPNMGSGTTVEAALLEGNSGIGIDRIARFVNLSQMRVDRCPR